MMRHGFLLVAAFGLMGFDASLGTVASTALAQSKLSFDSENGDYPAGLGPTALVTGDLNGDGLPDIAVVNNDSDDVSIFYSNGDGSFLDAGTAFPTGQSPTAIAIADFNNDGKMDIVTANEIDDTVSVLLNLGELKFGPAISTATGQPAGSPQGLVVHDFNHDGKLDVAVTDDFDDLVVVLQGLGDGSFINPTTIGVGASPEGIAAADLDGDGETDLVITNLAGGLHANGTLSILKGLGDGTFSILPEIVLPETCGTPSSCAPVNVKVVDLNRDSKLDLVVVNQDADSIAVLLGSGNLQFQSVTSYGVGSFPFGVATADFDGDGKPDIATSANFLDNIFVLAGVGDGTLRTASLGESTVAESTPKTSPTLLLANASAFPNSGLLDLGTEQIQYFGRTGNSLNLTESLSADLPAGRLVELIGFGVGQSPDGIASADFNHDGKPDLVTANSDDGTITVLLNTTSTITPPSCAGDCDGGGDVTVNELIVMVNIALGSQPVSMCMAGDVDRSGDITINEIIAAVNRALNGCNT